MNTRVEEDGDRLVLDGEKTWVRNVGVSGAIESEQRSRPPNRLQASLAKLYSVDMVECVVSEALQIHGRERVSAGTSVGVPLSLRARGL